MSKLLEGLNSSQQKAVTHETGPLLIIAGPGSGKTRTVVHSIAYAIENGVMPDQILAFSFTVKASEELQDQVKEIVGDEKGHFVNISTFHSFCRQVLRKDIDKLSKGYARDFRALEENDQKRIVTNLTRINEQRVRTEIDYIQNNRFPGPDEVLNFIKKCKATEIYPSDAGSYAPDPYMSEAFVEIYESYEQRLKVEGWIDYESQQLFTDELFRKVYEVKAKWQDKFEIVFVDEYQDTDPVQYRIIKALAERHQNLRVVGDDDQGIYEWRGADIQNILNFEKDYPNAKMISLGQNYRSTQQIVEASRALAEFNPDRREKELFTRNFEGEKIKHLHSANHEREAAAIAGFIQCARQAGRSPSDFAVLYRTNRQAEAFTEAFNELEIPCHVVGSSSNRDINGVSLMTIHKAKGLEFPNVFVAGVCTGLLPLHNSNEKDWDEELRLLYVAMTRAQNWLCLSSYEEDTQYPRGKSPFLDYIPTTLLESVDRLGNIPPSPKKMIVPAGDEEITEYVDPLPIGTQTVIGIDPGNIGANTTNVGWSITQKSSHGYSVLDFGTERPTGTSKDKLEQIEQKIKSLIQFSSNRPHAIAVEKLEIATEEARKEWFLYVAACVATVRSIANKEGIECRLYTPQHVKYAATDNRKASKRDVQKAVKRMCNLQQIPEPHHSADAIATSLCYLRSYLNSSRFEGNKQKREHYETGCDYLDRKQYETAINTFKKTINIDPVYTEAHCGLGRAYLVQNDLDRAVTAAQTALKLAENNHPDSQKLLDAIAHYRSGCNFLKNSEWNMAIDKFQESINLEPIFTEAHCELSRAYLEVGNLEAAKNAAEEALRLRNEYPSARKLLYNIKMKYYYKGEVYFNREEYDQAIFEFQSAVEIDQDFKGAHLYLGKAYFKKLEDLEAAEGEVRETLRVHSTYQPAVELLGAIKQKHKERGDGYRNRKAYAEAVKSYQQAIRIDNKYKEVYNNLGTTYWDMKEYSKAISAYQQAISIDERYQGPHNNLGMVYRKIGESAKAVSSLKRAIVINPDYQRAHYNLALIYFETENLQDASKTVIAALRLDANDQNTLKLSKNIRHAYLKQGRDYFRRSDLAIAELCAKEVLKLDSNYEPAIDLLGDIKQEYYVQALAYIKNCAHTEAINTLRKTVEIDPDSKEAHYSLGATYFKIGVLELAEKAAREVLRIDRNYELACCLLSSIKEEYYKRGLTALEQCKWKSVEKLAEEALRIDPNYQLASGLLKQAYYEQCLAHIQNGRYVEGINKLQKAKDIDPNCEKIHYHLGLAYFKLNRLTEAQMMAEKALSIQPNYPRASKLLSEINDARNWLKVGGAKVRRLVRWIANRIGS